MFEGKMQANQGGFIPVVNTPNKQLSVTRNK